MIKALVIEDVEEIATNIIRMLELLEVEARSAYSVREAMLYLLEEKPNIVFLDISMPGFDGFEVLTYLRREPKLANVPVCIVTTDSQEETKKRARKLGVLGYVLKPPTVNDFERVLADAGLLPEGKV